MRPITPDIRQRIRNGVQTYVESGNRNPVTLRDLHGPGWDDVQWPLHATIGAWFSKAVRKGDFPGLCAVGRDEDRHRLYARA